MGRALRHLSGPREPMIRWLLVFLCYPAYLALGWVLWGRQCTR